MPTLLLSLFCAFLQFHLLSGEIYPSIIRVQCGGSVNLTFERDSLDGHFYQWVIYIFPLDKLIPLVLRTEEPPYYSGNSNQFFSRYVLDYSDVHLTLFMMDHFLIDTVIAYQIKANDSGPGKIFQTNRIEIFGDCDYGVYNESIITEYELVFKPPEPTELFGQTDLQIYNKNILAYGVYYILDSQNFDFFIFFENVRKLESNKFIPIQIVNGNIHIKSFRGPEKFLAIFRMHQGKVVLRSHAPIPVIEAVRMVTLTLPLVRIKIFYGTISMLRVTHVVDKSEAILYSREFDSDREDVNLDEVVTADFQDPFLHLTLRRIFLRGTFVILYQIETPEEKILREVTYNLDQPFDDYVAPSTTSKTSAVTSPSAVRLSPLVISSIVVGAILFIVISSTILICSFKKRLPSKP